MEIGCSFTHLNEELHGHENMPWPLGQDSAALSGRFIVPPDRHCQRLLSTNRRNTWRNLATQRSLDFGGVCAVLEPQSCDVLAYRISTESPDASGGCRGFIQSGDRRSQCTRRLFQTAERHRETSTA